MPADTVLSNFETGSPVEEIADNFDMPEQTTRYLLIYAAKLLKEPVSTGRIVEIRSAASSSAVDTGRDLRYIGFIAT